MRRTIRTLTAAAAIAITAVAGVSGPAEAAPSLRHFGSCSAVHAVYSGGIAKKGVTKNTVRSHGHTTRRSLKGHVKHSTALYKLNKKLDRDKDGIACEKS